MREIAVTKVMKIINKYDPIHLIDDGAPLDEYKPEAEMISKSLAKMKNLGEINTLVHKTFVNLFDKSLTGKREDYHSLSKDLHNLLKKYKKV